MAMEPAESDVEVEVVVVGLHKGVRLLPTPKRVELGLGLVLPRIKERKRGKFRSITR